PVTEPTSAATAPGLRKIPLPMTKPTTSVSVAQNPSRRGSGSSASSFSAGADFSAFTDGERMSSPACAREKHHTQSSPSEATLRVEDLERLATSQLEPQPQRASECHGISLSSSHGCQAASIPAAARRPDSSAPCIQPRSDDACSPAK